MIAIEASILAADFARLGEQAQEAEAAGVDGLQIDVMDGRFVPNITFGPGVVRALRPLVDVTLDVDLMIVEPERHLAAFAEAGADRLTVHLEACTHPYRVLQSIRELGTVTRLSAGIEAGIAIGPDTPVSALEGLQSKLAHEIEHTVGVPVPVRFVEPHTIERRGGKAKRVIDKRGGTL